MTSTLKYRLLVSPLSVCRAHTPLLFSLVFAHPRSHLGLLSLPLSPVSLLSPFSHMLLVTYHKLFVT